MPRTVRLGDITLTLEQMLQDTLSEQQAAIRERQTNLENLLRGGDGDSLNPGTTVAAGELGQVKNLMNVADVLGEVIPAITEAELVGNTQNPAAGGGVRADNPGSCNQFREASAEMSTYEALLTLARTINNVLHLLRKMDQDQELPLAATS